MMISKKCPKCGSDNISKILYGEVGPLDDELLRKLKEDNVVLGGCCVGPEKWKCIKCGHKF